MITFVKSLRLRWLDHMTQINNKSIDDHELETGCDKLK